MRLTVARFVRQRQIFPFWLARTQDLQYVNRASTQAGLHRPFGPDDFEITSFSKRRRDSANEPLAESPLSAPEPRCCYVIRFDHRELACYGVGSQAAKFVHKIRNRVRSAIQIHSDLARGIFRGVLLYLVLLMGSPSTVALPHGRLERGYQDGAAFF